MLLFICFGSQSIGAQSSKNDLDKLTRLLKEKKIEQAFKLAEKTISEYARERNVNQQKEVFRQIELFRRYYRIEEEEKLLFQLRKVISLEEELEKFYFQMAVNQKNQLKYSQCLSYLDSLSFLPNFKINSAVQLKVQRYKSTIFSDLGFFLLSNEIGLNVLAELKKHGDSLNYYDLTQTIAYNEVQLGNYENALSSFNNSGAYYKRVGNKDNLINNYLNVGDLFWTMNRKNDAERSFLLAFDLAKERNRLELQMLSLRYLGLVTQSAGDLQKAQYYMFQAENMIKEYKLKSDEAQIKHTRLLIEIESANWTEAGQLIAWLDSSNTANIPELRIPKSTRIRYLISQNKPAEALVELDRIENGSSYPLNTIHELWFRIWIKALLNPTEAEVLLTNYLENEFIKNTTSFGSDYHKALVSALNSGLIKQAVEPLFNSNERAELVFKVNELIKGVLLSNTLDQNKEDNSSESDSLKLLAKQEQEQLSLMKLSGQSKALIQTKEQKLSSLYGKIEKVNGKLTQNATPSLLTLQQARNELGKNQLFVHLLETNTSYQVLLISSSKVNHFTLGDKAEIQKSLQSLISDCKTPNKPWNSKQSELLCDQLFPSKYIDITKFTEISISADGIWTAFPFETLMHAEQFLTESHSIRYVSSFSVANRLSERKTNADSGEILVFSNPEFPESSSWLPLSFSKLEAESIKKYWKEIKWYASTDATSANFKQELKKASYSIIHIATHGVTDKTPDQNRLVFSYEKDEYLGFFFPHSLSANSIHAKLVVLSACETATGQYISGEGLWGMQRSWLNAGAESVLAGLWQVNDRSTALYMDSFYKQLKERDSWINRKVIHLFSSNLSFSERALSVAEAKKVMIKNREYRHPYFWAGLMYFGL